MDHPTVTTIQLFGGHLALDFTNTIDSRGERVGPDVLVRYGDLLAWGMRVGVLAAEAGDALARVSPQRGRAALARAKALREALYRLFAASGMAGPADLAVLEREIQSAQRARMLVRHAEGGYEWRWDPTDPHTITHQVAFAAGELLTAPERARVRVCPGVNCGWLFLDTSRTGRRLWCSEETCGRRNRIRRWRGRKRAEA